MHVGRNMLIGEDFATPKYIFVLPLKFSGPIIIFPSLPGLKRPCNPISSVIPKQGVCTILMTGLPMPFYESVLY